MLPPKNSTISLQMLKPNPMPCYLKTPSALGLFIFPNIWNKFLLVSSSIPIPVSLTKVINVPQDTFLHSYEDRKSMKSSNPPSFVNLTAFYTILSSID